ncbi:hypothetical protein BACCAP_04532 [Pseudoflavonifractor capillosus ATCC 29799]|uniref:Uncharacterized protein n=1 Tax=Pseudoflavonifractor capillosus ATCC 29799 TaxID=411467 RepID=A6P204_9FIRM|nr:hypothetical protein BACCAP_04532 [Pseudoflavonifractor capillosus ATCC 29799]
MRQQYSGEDRAIKQKREAPAPRQALLFFCFMIFYLILKYSLLKRVGLWPHPLKPVRFPMKQHLFVM